VILVERRPVADLGQRVDPHRPHRQIADVLHVVRREVRSRPDRGQPRHVIELAPVVDAAGGFVVVPANHGFRCQLAHAIDDRVGLGAVADQVAKHEYPIPRPCGVIEDDIEGVDVGVNVGQDQVAHLKRDETRR
jgi:hypothetical protein